MLQLLPPDSAHRKVILHRMLGRLQSRIYVDAVKVRNGATGAYRQSGPTSREGTYGQEVVEVGSGRV